MLSFGIALNVISTSSDGISQVGCVAYKFLYLQPSAVATSKSKEAAMLFNMHLF